MLIQRRAPERMTAKSGGQDLDPIDSFYHAARDPLRWDEAMADLARHTGTLSAMIATHDPVGGTRIVAGSGGASGEVDHIADHLWRHVLPVAVATGGEADVPPIVLIAPRNLVGAAPSHLLMPYPGLCTSKRVGWVAIALKAGPDARRDHARDRFAALRRHLVRALDITLDLAGAQRDAPSTITLLSAMPTAALLIETDSEIVQANAAARLILGRGDGVIETHERRFRATLASENQRLAAAIDAALAAGRTGRAGHGRQVLRLRAAENAAPLLVILDPVPLGQRPSWLGAPRAAVLVRMIGEGNAPEGMTYPLQAAFDLTPAETRIAGAIASGLSPATAAHHLDLSTNTVRSHLARIFDKTGTRSQHALTRLLAGIGSWPLS